MRKLIPLFAAVPILFIAWYVLEAPAGSRVELFAALSAAWLGAWELVAMARTLVVERQINASVSRHGLIGVAGWLIAYAVTSGMPALPFGAGCLLFTAGAVIPLRSPDHE